MNISNRAVISFKTADGYVARFSIPRANTAKTSEEAVASMTRILESGALKSEKGPITTIHGAKIIKTVRTQIY